jgi:tetratricopeptide (TPR) repeat protein
MSRRFLRPGLIQLLLALAAVAYLASVWFFPQLNPWYGLALVTGLAALGGLAVWRLSNRDGEPPPLSARSEEPMAHTQPSRPMRFANASGAAPGPAGSPRLALAEQQAALARARQAGDAQAEAAALGQIGRSYADLGDWPAAIAHYQQQLRLLRAAGDRASEARASWDLGLAYEQSGDLPPAIAAMQVYVDYQRATGQPEAETAATLLDELRAQLASETTAPAAALRSPGK